MIVVDCDCCFELCKFWLFMMVIYGIEDKFVCLFGGKVMVVVIFGAWFVWIKGMGYGFLCGVWL